MYNKEVFFDLENLESYNNIYIKTTNITGMKKRKKELDNFWTGGSEGPHLTRVLKDNKIDKENLYIIKYGGGLSKYNIKSMECIFVKNTSQITLCLNTKLNKYVALRQKKGKIEGGSVSLQSQDRLYFYVIKNNKRIPISYKVTNINEIEQFYTVKQQEDNYFMKVDDEIYVYGNYYRIYFNYTVKNTDGTTITKNRDTGIDTSTTKDTEFIEFKDGTFVIKHKNITKNVSIDQKYKTSKLIDIKFYYDFRRHYLIYLETDNQYNINNFNDLITCNNKVILKKVYSALHASGIYGKEMVVEGIVSRNGDNHEKTIYECTNGFTGVKNSYLEGYSIDGNNFILQPQNKLFGLTDLDKGPLHVPYSYFNHLDSPFSVVFHNNTYHIYSRLNTKKGHRQIQYTTSTDMVHWDKYKLLRIKGFDIKTDHMYHPNICEYENTKYLIGILKHHNTDMQRLSYDIVMSRDGVHFKTVSTILSFYCSGIHYFNKDGNKEDFYPFMNGLIEYNNRFNLYFFKMLSKEIKFILYEYSCHIDELFYLTTDYHATVTTKLIKVLDNKITFNYKCKENGYINVKLTDKYNNNIKGYNFQDFDTLTSNNYDIKVISWNDVSNVTHNDVKIHIEMSNSNIYSISGKFYESKKYFNHLIYKVDDLTRIDGFLEGKSEYFSHINLLDKYGMNVKEIMGEIEYNEDNTKAYINIRLVDDSKERIILHDSTDDIIKHNDLSFKRPICILDYKLINIPL